MAEVLLRDGLTWRPLALAVGLLLASTMLWRRTHPLLMVALAFGTLILVDVISLVATGIPLSPYTGGVVLILVFALTRWADTPESFIGLAVVVLGWALAVVTDASSIEEAIGGALVLLLAAALGLATRYRAVIRDQQFEQIRSRERESLARELHDVVAHHVSAIAIQAQAGRFLASASDTEGAVRALTVIEHEASRTLVEMRAMVGALRRTTDAPDLSAPRTMDDIEAMATPVGSTAPVVEVERRGELGALGTSVPAALHRVVQEAITNARRHARRPTLIHVLLDGGARDVEVTVTDDGEPAPPGPMTPGYGLVGMTERVTMLGGTLTAGPLPGGGWRVHATIPWTGVRS